MVYEVNEQSYGFIPSFHAHQHLNPREQKSQLPEPPGNIFTTREARDSDASPRDSDVQGGREGKGKESNTPVPPEGVTEKVWADFLKLRKTKKAPVTGTALDGIRAEAAKAGYTLSQALETCCKRGWQGFEADWVGKSGTAPGNPFAGAI
jgi:hypothetical protein